MVVRPVVLVDVDGVLNVPGAPGFVDHDVFAGEVPVRLNPVHGVWIGELARVFDVVWATGWSHEANRLLAPLLGVGPFPVVEMPAGTFVPEDKVPRVAAYVGARPVAWVDDQLTPVARRWAASRRSPTLLVPVDPAVGLTRVMVDELLAWARAVSTAN
ncbi:hypothetical protein [Actinoplanes awajinensis]|uniref:Secreted protein n=1 Tax=Actinoplanes awajinensis subsp. mycoplanecinus TaxID=135947 RepID=A0A101JQ04_9ACTN|nr:hypothetical protein [Actinoplanes awajinensis]KUL30855.1 hypothetical protein ADL15_23115 [Actinoplanes awajinensis subsp. mycoplanecinus]